MSRMAVVTGADSGIGFATARRLLDMGVAVVAVDVNDDAGMRSLAAAGAEVRCCDLSDDDQRTALAGRLGDVDHLVNAAGAIRPRPIGEVTIADWDLQVEVNAKATFFLTQELGRAMRPGGAIVNLSSISARRAVNTESAVYAASKAAILSLTRSFAHAYADRGIRVNAVLPGLIDTPMQERLIHDMASTRDVDVAAMRHGRTGDIPLGRTGTPDEVADLIVWLLSPESCYVTGQALTIDGGLTMF